MGVWYLFEAVLDGLYDWSAHYKSSKHEIVSEMTTRRSVALVASGAH
jgi:hypothetical protein